MNHTEHFVSMQWVKIVVVCSKTQFDKWIFFLFTYKVKFYMRGLQPRLIRSQNKIDFHWTLAKKQGSYFLLSFSRSVSVNFQATLCCCCCCCCWIGKRTLCLSQFVKSAFHSSQLNTSYNTYLFVCLSVCFLSSTYLFQVVSLNMAIRSDLKQSNAPLMSTVFLKRPHSLNLIQNLTSPLSFWYPLIWLVWSNFDESISLVAPTIRKWNLYPILNPSNLSRTKFSITIN